MRTDGPFLEGALARSRAGPAGQRREDGDGVRSAGCAALGNQDGFCRRSPIFGMIGGRRTRLRDAPGLPGSKARRRLASVVVPCVYRHSRRIDRFRRRSPSRRSFPSRWRKLVA
jgi:hypothetical protein